jgi:predicted transcriptional regulator
MLNISNHWKGKNMPKAKMGNHEFLQKSLDIFKIILRHTEAAPVKAEKIVDMTGAPERMVTDVLKVFERSGFNVCSRGIGFFAAANDEEFKRHNQKEMERGKKIIVKAVQAKKNRINQPTIFDEPLQQSSSSLQA